MNKKRSTDLEKMVAAISNGDHTKASKLLEKTIKAKAKAQIGAVLKSK